MSADQVDAMFSEVDLDRDGRLSYPEVKAHTHREGAREEPDRDWPKD